MKRAIAGIGVALTAGVLALSAGASPAHADQEKQFWWGSPKPTAVSVYYDQSNQFCLWDMKSDNHSVLAKWHFVGAPTHQLWNHNGNSDKFVCHAFKRSNENKTIVYQLCTGEWAAAPANRRVIRCSARHSFWI